MTCQECGDETDELVTMKVGSRKQKLCEECAELAEEQLQIAAEAESAMPSTRHVASVVAIVGGKERRTSGTPPTIRIWSPHSSAISFVLCNMVHITNWLVHGMQERFPKLKVLWIESGLTWLAFIGQRI